MDEKEAQGLKPPYLSYQTFSSFIDELASRPLPPQLDRSMLSTKSGTDQAGLLSALKFFDLTKGENVVQPKLSALVTGHPEQRKALLAQMVKERYATQLGVSAQNGTEKNLVDSFDQYGITGETRRKAMTFFLHAARAAGLTLSAYFPTIRSGSGSTTGTRAKRTVKRRVASSPSGGKPEVPQAPSADGDVHSVTLRSGGTVTVAVTVNLFKLSREDRDFVLDLIDRLTGYGTSEEP